MTPLSGFYINLDRSAERRARMEEQFSRLGMSDYQRIAAIDGAALERRASERTAGELGCYRSHIKALEAARDTGANAHILEDDAILSPLVQQCQGFLDKAFDRFDIIFTETFIQLHLSELRFFKRKFDELCRDGGLEFDVLDISTWTFTCLSSYFVSAATVPKLIAALDKAWEEGPVEAVDETMRSLANAGVFRVGCVFPFISTVGVDELLATTITQRPTHKHDVAILASGLLRQAFYFDADLSQLRPHLDRIGANIHVSSGDPRLDLLTKVCAFAITSDHV